MIVQDVKTVGSPFSGDLIEDMEIAKRLIAAYPHVNLKQLMTIAADRQQSPSARVAAIYVLGFTDDHGQSKSVLARLAEDSTEPYEIRDHAGEALSSITPHRLCGQ